MNKESILGNLKVGVADVKASAAAHIAGVREGNRSKRGGGHITAQDRSTGINAKDRLPIDPRMPKLSPA